MGGGEGISCVGVIDSSSLLFVDVTKCCFLSLTLSLGAGEEGGEAGEQDGD